jgi:hypothetical protein
MLHRELPDLRDIQAAVANAVQGETSGKLNIPAVLKYRVKT